MHDLAGRQPWRLTTVSSLLTALLAVSAWGQQPFEPIPPAVAPQYHFNFARNFFPSPAAEKAQRAGYDALLRSLERMKGSVASTPQDLLRTLELNDRAQAELMRHVIYLYLRYATNTRDTEDNDTQSRLQAEFNEKTSFIQDELMRIDQQKFDAYAARLPALKKYAFEVESARRLRPHTLSLKEEELLNAIAPQINDWPGELYQRAIDDTHWAKVSTPQGELDVRKNEGVLANSLDRKVREQAFKEEYQGLASHRDFYAFALTKQVRARDQESQLRHYPDYPSEAYFGLYLTEAQVKGLFERLAEQAEFNKRYQRLRAAHVQKITGYPNVQVWDMTVVPPGVQRPRFTIAEATKDIEAALATYGAQYARELAALLNPANGRLDIVPGENRVPGAFSWGFPGSQTSIFYSYNFEGYQGDVSTLAHEAGHAVHFQLMGANHVLPVYTSGPTYFTESFAMFNELLIADYLYRKETDPARKTIFLEQFLNQAMSVFGITRQAALEQAIYDGVKAGKVRTADDLDALAKRNGERYSIWFEKNDDLKMEWIDVHHYYTQPMYYVNYVFAQFLALKYYEMYTRNPKGFIPRYMAMVRNGFNSAPSAILGKFLGISLQDPRLVSDAFSILDNRIKALETLYETQ